MKNLSGQRLKETRERRGFSLEHVAHHTRLPRPRVVDLEEGKWTAFGGEVYARHSLKAYARFLNVDLQAPEDDTPEIPGFPPSIPAESEPPGERPVLTQLPSDVVPGPAPWTWPADPGSSATGAPTSGPRRAGGLLVLWLVMCLLTVGVVWGNALQRNKPELSEESPPLEELRRALPVAEPPKATPFATKTPESAYPPSGPSEGAVPKAEPVSESAAVPRKAVPVPN